MKERLSITVPGSLIKKVRETAKKENRSLSNMVAVLLQKAVNTHEKK